MNFSVSEFRFGGLFGFSNDFFDEGLKISTSKTTEIWVCVVEKAVEKGFAMAFIERSESLSL